MTDTATRVLIPLILCGFAIDLLQRRSPGPGSG